MKDEGEGSTIEASIKAGEVPDPPLYNESNSDPAMINAYGSIDVVKKTRAWASNWIVKHKFCPWAARSLEGNRLRVVEATHDGGNSKALLTSYKQIVEECTAMIDDPQGHKISSTLLVYPSLSEDFDLYLDFAETVEAMLESVQLSESIQVATFHPNYQFQDTEPERVENFTNRSPYAIIHLLRVDEVTRAVESFDGETEKVWERNIQYLNKLGEKKVSKLYKKAIKVDATEDSEKKS
jgi:hypothetical protein